MGKAIREIISYTGYTVSIYFLCRYVNGDYGLIYKIFVWFFLTSTVLLFENNGKEVVKEIFKSCLILICASIIDIFYWASIADLIEIFITQLIWQLISVIIVIWFKSSIKLHGKYALKLAMCMSFIGFLLLIILQCNVVISLIIVSIYGFFMGVAANLSCPETDGKCCPQIAGHGVKKNRLCFN